jgi:hypothetical protein
MTQSSRAANTACVVFIAAIANAAATSVWIPKAREPPSVTARTTGKASKPVDHRIKEHTSVAGHENRSGQKQSPTLHFRSASGVQCRFEGEAKLGGADELKLM